MSEIDIGTLDMVPVRDVWSTEDNDFTPWLADNPQLISEALGMELELDGVEVPVGGYRVDLVFQEVSSGASVVIENMFGSTDHDHLGKLITYAAGIEDTAYDVLVAEEFRPEHRSALNWLNSASTEDHGFFGLGLEAWKIGDSKPAPRLRVVVQPDDWSRSVRATRNDSEREILLRQFWEGIQTAMRAEGNYWAGVGRPLKQAKGTFKSRQGVMFNITFCRPGGVRRLRCEAYIDTRNKQENKNIYEYFLSRKSEIEEPFQGTEPLEWLELEEKRASLINVYFPDPIGYEEEDKWPAAQEWAVPTLRRLRSAIEPVLDDYMRQPGV